MSVRLHSSLAVVVGALLILPALHAQTPLGTAFTYQGQLKEAGIPAEGEYDFVFRLFDVESGPGQVGGDLPIDDWPVMDGLFTVGLDFGTGVFTGEARWLEVAVRPGASGDPYTVLSPRQPLTAAPYALYALDGPGSAGYWAGSGDDIYNANSGNVGVGTDSPEHPLHVSGDFRSDGRTALGNEGTFGPDPTQTWDWIFDASHTITDFSSAQNWNGVNSHIYVDPDEDLTGANDKYIYSHDFGVTVPAGNDHDIEYVQGPYVFGEHRGGGDLAVLAGSWSAAHHAGSGHIAQLVGGGFSSIVANLGTATDNFSCKIVSGHWGSGGSITNDYGVYVYTPFHDRPLENHYGIYLEDQDFGVNDSYAIYNAGGDSYFNGDLDVTGDVRGRERVAFGNDASIGLDGNGDKVFEFSHTIMDFSSTAQWQPFRSCMTVDPSINLTGPDATYIYGHQLMTRTPQGNAQDIEYLQGPYMAAWHDGSGTVGVLGGGFIAADSWGDVTYQVGGTVASWGHAAANITGSNSGLEVGSGHIGSGGSVQDDYSLYIWSPEHASPLANHYGIYLEDQDFGVNDSYAIYVAGGDSYFNGDLEVTGTVSKGGGSFKIDHPLDPENKYLYHSFVESPDMMNVYNGNVVCDADGEATVDLPEWFEALNRDFRYQLTAIGAPGPNLYIAETIRDNRFTIAGGEPGLEVSWQVTGIRQDAFAEAHRILVEEDKPDYARGYYLHPEAHGQPADRHIEKAHQEWLGVPGPSARDALMRGLRRPAERKANHPVVPGN